MSDGKNFVFSFPFLPGFIIICVKADVNNGLFYLGGTQETNPRARHFYDNLDLNPAGDIKRMYGILP